MVDYRVLSDDLDHFVTVSVGDRLCGVREGHFLSKDALYNQKWINRYCLISDGHDNVLLTHGGCRCWYWRFGGRYFIHLGRPFDKIRCRRRIEWSDWGCWWSCPLWLISSWLLSMTGNLGYLWNLRVECKGMWSDCNLEMGMELVLSDCPVPQDGQVIVEH